MKRTFDPSRLKSQGNAFERRVVRLFRRMGYFNVKRQVFLVDSFGNRSEIDVIAGIFNKKYIECKCYSEKPVPLSDVAKFKSVLQLNNIDIRNGVFITSSTFTPRAITLGVKCIDGKALSKMEKKIYRRYFFKRFLFLSLVLSSLWFLPISFWQDPFIAQKKNEVEDIGEKIYKQIEQEAKKLWKYINK